MTLRDVHPKGFYGKQPWATWDLAEARWLKSRSGLLLAECRSCHWFRPIGPILPTRVGVEKVIAGSQHWYECPGDRQVEFMWTGPIRAMNMAPALSALQDAHETLRRLKRSPELDAALVALNLQVRELFLRKMGERKP